MKDGQPSGESCFISFASQNERAAFPDGKKRRVLLPYYKGSEIRFFLTLDGDSLHAAIDADDFVREGRTLAQTAIVVEQGATQIAGVIFEVFHQDLRAGVDILSRIEQGGSTTNFLNLAFVGTRQYLHQTTSANPAHGPFLKHRFDGDDGKDQFWVHIMAFTVADRFTNNFLCLLFRNLILALEMLGKLSSLFPVSRFDISGITAISLGGDVGSLIDRCGG